MSAPLPPTPPSMPVIARDRLRLFALLALLALWMGPTWVTAQVADGTRPETGAVRSGIAAALALVALWGLAATSLAARTLRELRMGAALTDAVLALVMAGLLIAKHPWIPGGDLREAWVPVFAPLVLLAALDAAVVAARPDAGHGIAVIRAGAALFAAAALAIDAQWIPAGMALWLGVSALMFLKLERVVSARRSLEGFVLVAAAVVGLAPWIHRQAVGWNPAIGDALTLPIYLWCITAALLVTTAIDGLLRPEAEHESA